MVSSVESSAVRLGPLITEISARISPGMTKSASSRPRVRRSATSSPSGPAIRSEISWRSPTKVSDCQSTERTLVSKILSRGMPARAMRARSSAEAAVEIAIFSIGPSLDKRAPVRPSRGGGQARSSSRRRSADRPVPRAQIAREQYCSGAETSPPLSASAPYRSLCFTRLGCTCLSKRFPTCLGNFLQLLKDH